MTIAGRRQAAFRPQGDDAEVGESGDRDDRSLALVEGSHERQLMGMGNACRCCAGYMLAQKGIDRITIKGGPKVQKEAYNIAVYTHVSLFVQ